MKRTIPHLTMVQAMESLRELHREHQPLVSPVLSENHIRTY